MTKTKKEWAGVYARFYTLVALIVCPLMLKTTVQKVIRETVGNTVLTKEQKQQVFNNVCFNLMKEGRISSIQYERWTTAF